MSTYEDDEYEIPLRDQRYFGAGIKRKRVKFVTSSTADTKPTSSLATPAQSAADAYLSIVFNKPRPTEGPTPYVGGDGDEADPEAGLSIRGDTAQDEAASELKCDICHRRIEDEASAILHESSMTHQICLKHSHPPSHLNRRRKGLAVLESQGWDPDARIGLGTEGGGILYPIKARKNPDRAGLGMDLTKRPVRVEKLSKLDAGKVQAMEKEGKKKAAKLRDAFYRSEDMEKYLGAEGETNTSLDMAAFTRGKQRRRLL